MHCQVLLSVYYTQGLVPGVGGTEDRLKEKKIYVPMSPQVVHSPGEELIQI